MIEGFLMQQTNFDYEIIIADDCSTDDTGKIIKEYEKKHPHVFNSLHRKKNMGAIPNLMEAMKHAKGEYIALCEGDDYWTNPQKLQKQVDFMDKNRDYSICFHPVKITFEDSKETSIFPEDVSNLTLKRLVSANYIQTNSVLYRRQDYSQLKDDVMPGDWYLHLFHAQFGKIGCINEAMSVYRRHSRGLWWDARKGPTLLYQKHAQGFLALFAHAYEYYSHDKTLAKIITSNAIALVTALLEDKTNNSNNAEEILQTQPGLVTAVVLSETSENNLLKVNNQKLEFDNATLKAELGHRDAELQNIKASKVWKTVESYRRLKPSVRKKGIIR